MNHKKELLRSLWVGVKVYRVLRLAAWLTGLRSWTLSRIHLTISGVQDRILRELVMCICHKR